ncbi:MAG: hypothetical protein VYB44_07430 [Bacteroidota bacterium]|nr:hypothetical protein [Bacteroidota bacterium]
MEIENVNVAIHGEAPDKPIEIILREGKTPEPIALKDKRVMRFDGDIDTPFFIAKGMPHLKSENTVIYVEGSDSNNPKILIDFNPQDPYGATAEGRIIINPTFEKFQFNKRAAFDNQSFIAVIKENAHVFDSKEIAKNLIKSLQNFKAKIETEITDKDDRKGNTDMAILTRLKREESGIPDELKVTLPILKNGKPINITTEVEIDIQGNTVLFGFFSLEVVQVRRETIDSAINYQIELLTELGIPIVFK